MKFINKNFLTYCFVIILLFSHVQSNLLEKNEVNNRNKSKKNKDVDDKLLKSVNNLKNFMINKQGAQFSKLGLKFITKDNRYVIAEENIPVT